MRNILAQISSNGNGLVSILIHLVIIGCVFAILWWLITKVIPLPPPFLMVAKVILGIVAAIFLIDLLLGLDGGSGINW